MSLFPRYFATELAPATNVFRLFDDYANQLMDQRQRCGSQVSKSFRTFSPRFDVKETHDSYELHGELPGIEQENVQIEFTDSQTLVIKGRTEQQREEGERSSDLVKGQSGEEKTNGGSSNNHYHKPSVEDEGQGETSGSNSEVEQQGKPTQVQKSEPELSSSRYWVSERSVGEFARTFSFRSRVDQDKVKASLKDGILSIVVPKLSPTSKRINIE